MATNGSNTPSASTGQVIPLRNNNQLAISPNGTEMLQLAAWSESWLGVPVSLIADRDIEWAERALPKAIPLAKAELEPGDPAEVLSLLQMMAERRQIPLPDGLALELDVEIMSEWPSDLFRQAFKAVWTSFTYRRFPEVADFFAHIRVELDERKERLARLETLNLKLCTNVGRPWQIKM